MKKQVISIRRKLLHLRLRPIRVFCFHQVSDEFEPETMKECDWMQIDVFKKTILSLKEKYIFVSLRDAYNHIANDKLRMKHYAVLTADDGCASLKNILPWLDEQNIPVTLFLNPLFFDGVHFRENANEKYLTLEEVEQFALSCKRLSVALHGWGHKDVSAFSESEFRDDIDKSRQALKGRRSYIPFYAYPWGRHKMMNDNVLRELLVS